MSQHPYSNLGAHAFWRRSVASVNFDAVDPVVASEFEVAASDKVVTAGSCFAQHIARYLRAKGFRYWVTESAHPMLTSEQIERFNYGVYSARYGNLYTTRQLRQLFERAYGEFSPSEDVWRGPNGEFIDPFRPEIQPGGFVSEAELRADRDQHLAAVRRAFEELDVFVFTLGLTECWTSRVDGAVFPLCPGVSGGTFDAERHRFENFKVTEIVADLRLFLERLRSVNPASRVILSVSPVPLMATAEPRHVLVSNTASKSALRVACDEVVASSSDVAYFPSYEIVTGQFHRGRYFAEDLRSVTEEGVRHVMRVFMRHYAKRGSVPAPESVEHPPNVDDHLRDLEAAARAVCEEEALDPEARA